MALSIITENDLAGKGVLGQPDVPGLSARDMQYAVEQITREVVIPKFNENAVTQDAVNEQILPKNNTREFTPTGDYAPATKKYVDDAQWQSGSVSSVFGRGGSVAARVGDYAGGQVVMTGYEKPAEAAEIATTDTVNAAIGKLDKRLDGKAASAHASTHGAGGADAVTPADIGAAAASELADYTPLIEDVSTARAESWTVSLADLGKTYLMQNSAAVVATLPTDTALALPVGFGFYLRRWGTGSISVAGDGASVYLNGALTSLLLGDRYVSVVAVVKVAANQWAVNGGLA